MALGDHDDTGGLLARASRVLRAAPEPGWDMVRDQVIDAVRETPRGGWPVTVVDPAPSTVPGTLMITDLVIRGEIARTLSGDPEFVVIGITTDVDGDELRSLRIDLSCGYGVDLHAAADRALAISAAVVEDLIGAGAPVPLEVVVCDVE